MRRLSPILIGTVAGALIGHFIGPYHGGAILFACVGLALGLLVELGFIRVW